MHVPADPEAEHAARVLFVLERRWQRLGVAPDEGDRFRDRASAVGEAGTVVAGDKRKCRACGTVNRDTLVRIALGTVDGWQRIGLRRWRSWCCCFGDR